MRNAILASVGIPLMESRYEKHYSGLHWLPLEGKLSAQLTDEVESSESDETASSDTDEVAKCMI